jgi:uncharacterized protein YbjQ (UPF0145 family)
MGRMLEAARARGGNAVIGMRFDTSEMGDVWTELCAAGRPARMPNRPRATGRSNGKPPRT